MRGRETGGRGVAAAQAVRREGPAVEAAGGARAERTLNMESMCRTLDVSKLSGWFNADAPCQVERGVLSRTRRRATCRPGGESA